MVFGMIMSVLLLSSGLSFILTDPGRMLPAGFRILPFLELGLLWLYVLLFKGKGGWPGTLFLIQYWIVFMICILPAGVGLWVIESFDRERRSEPIVLGAQEAAAEIAVIYHPGGSNFTGHVLRRLGGRLGDAGYRVVLHSAHRGLRLDLDRAHAVGFASPVYAGAIRPPLRQFVQSADLRGRRCFVILTGGPGPAEGESVGKELQSIVPLIEERGGRIAAAGKIPQNKETGAVEERIDAFAGELLAALK
ncbi:MAG: flavodoxin family protein [Bacteroidota bacterium]